MGRDANGNPLPTRRLKFLQLQAYSLLGLALSQKDDRRRDRVANVAIRVVAVRAAVVFFFGF